MSKTVLSLHIKWQIIEKTLEGLKTQKIAKHLGISKAAICHVRQYFRKYGYVKSPSLLDRPRIFNSTLMT